MMTSYKIKYNVWMFRIVPILKASGWIDTTIDGTIFMVNESFGIRFEYHYYGRKAPVWIGESEAMK